MMLRIGGNEETKDQRLKTKKRSLFLSLRSYDAFTLIEIILVVVILSVIVGVSIPHLSQSYRQIELRQTVQDITYLMRYAQSRSITQAKIIRFEFNDNFSEYWLSQSQDVIFERFEGRLGRNQVVPEGIVIKSDDVFCHFYPDGHMDPIQFDFCQKEKCLTLSTEEQRGQMTVYANQ